VALYGSSNVAHAYWGGTLSLRHVVASEPAACCSHLPWRPYSLSPCGLTRWLACNIGATTCCT